ncbi:MAG: hypothetical protein JNM36_02510 [Chitinophagales bacterium]|nr:hypothetical protein [Chitinophagales bacterium]
MTQNQHLLNYIQSHKVLIYFDYSKAVDWAVDLILQGKDSDNILMLASFSKPIDRAEIAPYLTNVLNELELEELNYESAILAITHYHLVEIMNDTAIRYHLEILYELYLDYDEPLLTDFYLLYLAWDDLENTGINYYFREADLNNIEAVVKKEAKEWVDKYINITE